MSRNLLWGLVVIVMIAAVILNQGRRSGHESETGALLFPSLGETLDEVHSVVIKNKDMQATLRRKIPLALIDRPESSTTSDQVNSEQPKIQWIVEEKYQLQIQLKQLRLMLNSLASARLVEKKTRKPENFSLLGVGEGGTEIQLSTDNQTYQLVIGNSTAKRKGRYIRLLGDDADVNQVWLISTQPDVSADPLTWLENSVIDVNADNIQQISFINDAGNVIVTRQDGQLALIGLPADAELKYPSIIDGLGRSLVSLRFDDIKKVAEIDFANASEVHYELVDSRRIIIQLVNVENAYWLRLKDHPRSDWAFGVDQQTYNRLTTNLQDLIKPMADPE
ncbi:MAG: DUF4340 domain-containing protein [Pseudomonadales bacterium]|nr:DUF4340 domain-containing protein [Pseudomonadales bacterium]